MGFIGLFYPWGVILQAVAILHFVRRRPDNYWLWIILIGGGLGALVYIVAEVMPDASLLRLAYDAMGRRRRIRDLEAAILDNPSVGNIEELADQYLDDGRFARARELYDRVIASGRADSLHPYYRRGIAEVELSDFTAALAGPRPRRRSRQGRRAVQGRHRDFDAVRDVLQLRDIPGGPTAAGRGQRVGRADPRQETDHAALLAPAGEALVSQGQGPPQAAPLAGRRKTPP